MLGRTAGNAEVPFQVHPDDGVPLVLAGVDEHAVAHDAGVVHDGVEPLELLQGHLDDPAGTLELGDIVMVGDGAPAGRSDLGDDFFGRRVPRRLVAGRAVECHAEIVHDHEGALATELEGVGAPEPSARSRHDDGAAVEQADGSCPGSPRCARHGRERVTRERWLASFSSQHLTSPPRRSLRGAGSDERVPAVPQPARR